MVRVACKLLLLLLYRRLRSSSLKDEIDSGALLVTQCPAKDDPTRFHNIASAIFCFILFLLELTRYKACQEKQCKLF